MELIKAIVFDIDGTLVYLPVEWNKVLEELINLGITDARSFLAIISRYHGTEIFHKINEIVEDEELKAIEKMVILDDSPVYVKELCSKYKIGFVTMQSKNVAKRILQLLELDKCSHVVLTREDARTRIEQISKIIGILGVNPNEVLFFGDKIIDAIAAVINGVKAIIILRGNVNLRISDTDDLEEDLEVLGIPIARDLRMAIEYAKNLKYIE